MWSGGAPDGEYGFLAGSRQICLRRRTRGRPPIGTEAMRALRERRGRNLVKTNRGHPGHFAHFAHHVVHAPSASEASDLESAVVRNHLR